MHTHTHSENGINEKRQLPLFAVNQKNGNGCLFSLAGKGSRRLLFQQMGTSILITKLKFSR